MYDVAQQVGVREGSGPQEPLRQRTGNARQAAEGRAAPNRRRSPRPSRAPVEKTAHVKGLEDDLRQRLAVKIEIKVKAKDKGQIVIGFDSNDDFERIIQALQKQ